MPADQSRHQTLQRPRFTFPLQKSGKGTPVLSVPELQVGDLWWVRPHPVHCKRSGFYLQSASGLHLHLLQAGACS